MFHHKITSSSQKIILPKKADVKPSIEIASLGNNKIQVHSGEEVFELDGIKSARFIAEEIPKLAPKFDVEIDKTIPNFIFDSQDPEAVHHCS